jgi:hypothetical protein
MGARWSRSSLSLQVAALAVALVGVGPEPAGARTQGATAHHHHQRRLVRHIEPQPLRLRLPAADDFSDARGGNGDFGFAPSPSFSDRPPAAIDYRLAPRGPVGSLGLLRPSDTRAESPTNLDPSSGLRRGYPEVDAGAKLNYPF